MEKEKLNKKYWFFGSKFYNSRLNTILLFVLIILMIIALRFMFQNKEVYFSGIIGSSKCATQTIEDTMPILNDRGIILGNKEDLISLSITPNTKVHGVVSYRGVIKGGYFFEANILINILDANKNVLKNSNAMATTDWMTIEPVSFEGNIDFTGLPKGPAYLEIHNDNPSDIRENDKSILIPIIIN